MAMRVPYTIDARSYVANYPVAIGEVVEVYSSGRDAPTHLRIFEVRRVHLLSLVVVTGGRVATSGEIVGTGFGYPVRLHYSEVVLPWRYFFFNPIGWYV